MLFFEIIGIIAAFFATILFLIWTVAVWLTRDRFDVIFWLIFVLWVAASALMAQL